MATINMPQVGQDIETAVITEWRIKEGDTVRAGDVVALVESDKAVFEVEAFEAGTIIKLLYKTGEEGKVFEPIAILGNDGNADDKGERNSDAVELATKNGSPSIRRVLASPSARRLARQYDIDLKTISGSGPNGRIIKADIVKAGDKVMDIESRARGIQAPVDAPQYRTSGIPQSNSSETDHILPFSNIRQAIADRMTKSAMNIPHFYLFMDVDMTAALAWRYAFNVTSPEKISINDLIVRAVAQSLPKYPKMNAHIEPNRMIVKKEINIGLAVSVDDGLIVPVLQQADKKNIQELSYAAKEITGQAKKGVLKTTNPGTFTISNLGMFGINQFLPIINPPEAAILGVGAVVKTVEPGPAQSFAIRDRQRLTLACDHRAIDGAYAAEFLNDVKVFLERFE